MDDDSDIVCLSSDDTDDNQGSDNNCDGETRRSKVTFRLDQNGSDHSSIHGDDEDNNQRDSSTKRPIDGSSRSESEYSDNNAGSTPIYESDYVGLISNAEEDDDNSNNNIQHQEDACPQPMRICFNCDSTEHVLNSCPHPKNHMKVKEAFERFKLKSNSSTYNTKPKRYHQSNAKLYDSKKPGKVSEELREVLGLQPNQLPGHVYKMREKGYPPGWKNHAELTSTGLRFMDDPDDISQPREEENEQQKPVYDKEKIILYPGFNDPLPQNQYLDVSQFQTSGSNQKKKRKTNQESSRYGVQPYSDNYSIENCVNRWTDDHRRAKKRSHGEMRSNSNSSASQDEDRRSSRVSSASSSKADMWTSESSHHPHRRNPKEPRIMDDFERSDAAPYQNYQSQQQYPSSNNNSNNNFGPPFNQGMTQTQQPYYHDKYQARGTGTSSRSTMNYENDLPTADPRIRSYSGYPPPRFHNPRMMNSGYLPPRNSFNQNPRMIMNVGYPPSTNSFEQNPRMMNNTTLLSYPSASPSNAINPYNPQRFSQSHNEYFPTSSSSCTNSSSSSNNSRMNSSKNSTVQSTYTSASSNNNSRACRVRSRSPSLLQGPDIQTIDIEPPSLDVIQSYQKFQQRSQKQQQQNLPEGWDTAEPKELDTESSNNILLKNPLYQPSKRQSYPTKLKPPGEESSDDEIQILDPIPPKANKNIGEQVNKPKNPVEIIDLDDDDDDEEPKSSPEIVAVVLPPPNVSESSTNSSSSSEISSSNDNNNIQQKIEAETIIQDTACDSFCDKSSTPLVTQPDEIQLKMTTVSTLTTEITNSETTTEKEQIHTSLIEVLDNQINNNKEIPSTDNKTNDNQNEMIASTQENNASNIATLIEEEHATNAADTEFPVSSESSEKEQTSILTETPLTLGPVLCVKEEQEGPVQISISTNIFEREESDGEKSPSYNQENIDSGADCTSNNDNNDPSLILRALDTSNINCSTTQVPISYNNTDNNNDNVINNNTVMEDPEFFDEPPASPDQLEGNINEVETKVHDKATTTDISSCNDSSNITCNIDNSITGHLPDTPMSPDQTAVEPNFETEILVRPDKIIPTENMNNDNNNLAANEEIDTPLSPVQDMDIDNESILTPLLIPIENSNATTNIPSTIITTTTTTTMNFDSPASPEETMSSHINQELKQAVSVSALTSNLPTENMDTTPTTTYTTALNMDMDFSSSNIAQDNDLSLHLLDQSSSTCNVAQEPNMNSPSNNNMNILPLVQTQVSPIQSSDKNIIDLNSSSKLLPNNDNINTNKDAPDLTPLIPPPTLKMTHHSEVTNTSQNTIIINNSNLEQPSDKILENTLIPETLSKDYIDENKTSSSFSSTTSFETTHSSNNTISSEKDNNITSLSSGAKSPLKKSKNAALFSSLPPLEKFSHNMLDVGFPSAEMEATQRFQRISALIRSRKQQKQQQK